MPYWQKDFILYRKSAFRGTHPISVIGIVKARNCTHAFINTTNRDIDNALIGFVTLYFRFCPPFLGKNSKY